MLRILMLTCSLGALIGADANTPRVPPAGAFGANGGKARIAEDFEVLRDGGLGDAEFGGDHLDHFARGVLARRQHLEDAAADGIAEDVEGVHGFFFLLCPTDPEGARSANRPQGSPSPV